MIRLGEAMMILELHRQGLSVTASRTPSPESNEPRSRAGPFLVSECRRTSSAFIEAPYETFIVYQVARDVRHPISPPPFAASGRSSAAAADVVPVRRQLAPITLTPTRSHLDRSGIGCRTAPGCKPFRQRMRVPAMTAR